YAVGENIDIKFRIGSDAVSHASATLFDILPDGRVFVFGLGSLLTNVTYVSRNKVAPPLGIEQLLLSASAPGVNTTQRSCSFRVVSAQTPTPQTPLPTGTPTPTPTITDTPPSKTPTRTRTVTATPIAGLTGSIRTNRGCIEDGDNPVFATGEGISVIF